MIHEFKKILKAYKEAVKKNNKTVLASVVHLRGSSYRKPGVRMLIDENGEMTGAVSGGCVEKEIFKQVDSVFNTGIPKVMSYDGRYRLGCNGELFILIEPFSPSDNLLNLIEDCFINRKEFSVKSCFKTKFSEDKKYGSVVIFDNSSYSIRNEYKTLYSTEYQYYENILKPVFKLTIVGGEHDQYYLSKTAKDLGWEVEIILSLSDSRTESDFPEADHIHHLSASNLGEFDIQKKDTMVLMTHNYARDLKFLKALAVNGNPKYLGILGSVKRREQLLNELIEFNPDISEDFLNCIYAPAGLDLGAETPEEIALSICAEILSVIKKRTPESLKNKTGYIHTHETR